MPDTRYGHNPSGAADPTRTQAEENILKDEKRIGDWYTFCVTLLMVRALKSWAA